MKHSSDESVDHVAPDAKCARIDVEAKLASGELLAKVNVPSSLTGIELQAELEKSVGAGKRVQGVLLNTTAIGSRTLSEVVDSEGATSLAVSVVVGARPTMYMFEPCSAHEFAQRLVKLNDFGDVSDIPVFKEPIRFQPMDQAPSGAKEIANDLHGILQSSLGKMFPSPFGGFFHGHVVVITGINRETDVQLKQSLCEAMGGINAELFADMLDLDWVLPNQHDPRILEYVTFQEQDWSNADECPWANDVYALEDPGIDEEAMASAKAAQTVMVDKLTNHFLFEFDWDAVTLFPQVHGGFLPDGNMVGILSGRLVEA